MLRPILVLHRWMGVVIGIIMTIWCLSGFVMMYVDYPRLTPAEQLQGLSPLQLAENLGKIDLPADTPISAARIEMMADRPVLRIVPAVDPGRPIAQTRTIASSYDLTTGDPLADLLSSDIRAIAMLYGQRTGIAGGPARIAQTGMDQWTVQTFRRNQPLYRVDYADAAGTQVYVSGASGEVVQQTTQFERFWNWLGAVPHWLYPTMLRQDGELWARVVIWTSLIGCFLTVTGMWVGIARLRRRHDGSFGSPYKGLWWWHHMIGLFFGALTLSWVASGLFSMNPWGFLDSSAGYAERQRLAGSVRWAQIRAAIERVTVPPGTVRVESAPFAGNAFTVAIDRAGGMTRFDASGRRSPLDRAAVEAALRNGPPIAALQRIVAEDDYYYTHKMPAKLPAWRAILADGEATRLYIDADSGTLIRAFDRNGRGFRWLQDGLHSLDFALLRARPLWDLVVLPLLAMVTLVCGTGAWMGVRKLGRDARMLRRRLRKRLAATRPVRQPVVGEA